MSLMFFLSGVFVPSSLARKGSMTFFSDRFFRIGLPLALVVIFLMPVTYYPTYSATTADPSVSAYWQHLTALPFWPCGVHADHSSEACASNRGRSEEPLATAECQHSRTQQTL